MADTIWQQLYDLFLEGFQTALTTPAQTAIFSAVYLATNNATIAGTIAPMVTQTFVSQFAQIYVAVTMNTSRDQFASNSYVSGCVGAAFVANSVGSLLWLWAFRDSRRWRPFLMLLGTLFGLAFNCVVYAGFMRPEMFTRPLFDLGVALGGINISLLLCASLHSATFFWSSKLRRLLFLACMKGILIASLICFVVFVHLDGPDCGFSACTPRIRYIMIGFPCFYVASFFCFWLRSIWIVHRSAIGNTKSSVRTVSFSFHINLRGYIKNMNDI